MTLRVTSIADAGLLDRERLVMRAYADVNLTNYAAFCCHAGNVGFAGGPVPQAFWFWDIKIKKDDLVVLYTKAGAVRQKELDSSRTSHFFYWSLSEPIWTPKMRAVVVYTPSWSLFDDTPQPTE
jgi:hypothetical protein